MHIKLGVAAARIGRELEVAGLPPAFVNLAASGQAPPDQLQDGDQAELAYYREFGPAATPVAEPVRVAGMRWAIKAGFADAKGAVGLAWIIHGGRGRPPGEATGTAPDGWTPGAGGPDRSVARRARRS